MAVVFCYFFGFGCCVNSVDDVAVYCVHLFKCLI